MAKALPSNDVSVMHPFASAACPSDNRAKWPPAWDRKGALTGGANTRK